MGPKVSFEVTPFCPSSSTPTNYNYNISNDLVPHTPSILKRSSFDKEDLGSWPHTWFGYMLGGTVQRPLCFCYFRKKDLYFTKCLMKNSCEINL